MKKLIILIILAVTFSACTPAPKDVTCTINSHKKGDAVQQNETLAGSVQGIEKGWYLFAYTRAKLPAQPYWRSDKSAVIVGEDWTIDVVYGDEQTPSATEFETVILVTSNKSPASQVEQISDIENGVSCAQISLHR